MSSVGVMTFLHNDNYGSSLQAYALQQVIRESISIISRIKMRRSAICC